MVLPALARAGAARHGRRGLNAAADAHEVVWLHVGGATVSHITSRSAQWGHARRRMRWTGAVATLVALGAGRANADGAELALAALLAAAPADADGRVRELRVHALALAHDVREALGLAKPGAGGREDENARYARSATWAP